MHLAGYSGYFREHQQKTFVIGVSVNPLKKENFVIKIFFQLLLNKVLKSCEKIISADVKASRFILLSHKENTKKYHYKVNINI